VLWASQDTAIGKTKQKCLTEGSKPERMTLAKANLFKSRDTAFPGTKKGSQPPGVTKYCVAQGNGHKRDSRATELETAILKLLNGRRRGKSICPSEAAKLVGGRTSRHNWEALMEPTRKVARKMAKTGTISITQKGKLVDIFKTKGPIRLQLP